MNLNLTRNITPPDGYLAAAKQDGVFEAVSLNIADLPQKAQQTLPASFAVLEIVNGAAVQVYGWTGSGWEDMNSNPVSSTNITGTVFFRNPAAYDVEFVW